MENPSGLAERVAWLLAVSGVKARAASRLAGLPSEAYVGMLVRGDVASPQAATVEKIALALGATPAWLAFGTGDIAVERAAVERAAVERAAVERARAAKKTAHEAT